MKNFLVSKKNKDDSSSDSDKKSSSDSEKSDSEKDSEVIFNKKIKSSTLKLSKNNKVVTFSGSNNWVGSIIATKAKNGELN